MLKRIIIIVLATAGLAGQVYSAESAEARVAWVGEGWQFRQVVEKAMKDLPLALGTGATEIDTGGNVQPNGEDIRVTNMQNDIVPYRVVSVKENGRVRVEFKLEPGKSAYCIYYGNASAKPLSYEIGGKSGQGLHLIIKAYESGKVDSAEVFKSIFNSAKTVIGQGPRGHIKDHSNPFAEKNKRCLAIYSGILRAPHEGAYGFQLKATGPAFVEIEGKTVLSQLLASGHFTTKDGINLSGGDHMLKFYVYSRHPSSYIAELYWRTPGEDHFKIIPPESFSSSQYFTPVARHKRGRVLSAFFSHKMEGKLRVIGTDEVLTRIHFENMSSDMLGEIRENEWDFGDGTKVREKDPGHVYRKTGEYTVNLTVTDDMGSRDTYTGIVSIDRSGAEKIEVQWDLQEDRRLVDPGEEEIEVRQSFHMYSREERAFILRTTVLSGRKVVDSSEEPLELEPRKEILISKKLKNRDGSFKVKYSLIFRGIVLLERGLSLIEDKERFPKVTSDDTSIVDPEGMHVIVKLTGAPNRKRRRFTDIIKAKKNNGIRIALIDNYLCPGGRGYDESRFYYRKLQSMLQEEYPDAEVDVRRFASERDQLGFFPIRRMVSSADEIYGFDPDVIVISCDQQDMLNFTPSKVLYRRFALMVHNYIANTRAKIVLVTGPPRPEKAHRSKVFAVTLTKIALIHRVGLADVYQAVSLYEGDWRKLFLDEKDSDGVSYFHMNSKGQDIIARTLFKAIVRDR